MFSSLLALALALALSLALCAASAQQERERELFELQRRIDGDDKLARPPGDQMEPASQIFLTEHWRRWTGDKPIMVRGECVRGSVCGRVGVYVDV